MLPTAPSPKKMKKKEEKKLKAREISIRGRQTCLLSRLDDISWLGLHHSGLCRIGGSNGNLPRIGSSGGNLLSWISSGHWSWLSWVSSSHWSWLSWVCSSHWSWLSRISSSDGNRLGLRRIRLLGLELNALWILGRRLSRRLELARDGVGRWRSFFKMFVTHCGGPGRSSSARKQEK